MMSNYQVAAENNQQTSSITDTDTEILTWDNGERTGPSSNTNILNRQ